MYHLDYKLEVHTPDDINDDASGSISLPNGDLDFSVYPNEVISLPVVVGYLEAVARQTAHLLIATPTTFDDAFSEVPSETPLANFPTKSYHRSFFVFITDQSHYEGLDSSPVNFPEEYMGPLFHYSFPAVTFMSRFPDVAEAFLGFNDTLGPNIQILRGDTVERTWEGMFDECGMFLFHGGNSIHSARGRKFDMLMTTEAEWREQILPDCLPLNLILNNMDVMYETTNWDDLWEELKVKKISRKQLPLPI